MYEPIPFYGWLKTSEDIMTTFTTEDKNNAMINVIRVGYRTLEEAVNVKAAISDSEDYYIVQLRDRLSLMGSESNVLAYYVIHKNQEL
tara:strand:- start:87 stop:350 length:264 start_codon:yes stop_codon:yes gene_type:complete